MLKIKDVTINGNVFMAPLAGVTDISFRTILKEMGADLTYTEMVSAKALHYKNEKTKGLLERAPGEDYMAVQLFGSEPEILGEIAAMLDEREDIILIDINMGCPAPKIVKNHEGAYLMTEPKRASEILKSVKKNTKKPVTCKFRRGYEIGDETALEFAKMAESSGADLITVHGRYRDQFYSGISDRTIIKKIRDTVSIPVIGNGDIFTGEDALSMIKETNCHGVMVARGALGNPWIFREIKSVMNNERVVYPTTDERIDMALRHLHEAVKLREDNPSSAVREMRKHLAWYLKGLKNSTKVKEEVNKLEEENEVIEVLQRYKKELKEN